MRLIREGRRMTLYQKMLVFYAVMGCICAIISWFLTKESRLIRLLAALLIGATWPFSFTMALLVSLF
jgi:hypothetical protein